MASSPGRFGWDSRGASARRGTPTRRRMSNQPYLLMSSRCSASRSGHRPRLLDARVPGARRLQERVAGKGRSSRTLTRAASSPTPSACAPRSPSSSSPSSSRRSCRPRPARCRGRRCPSSSRRPRRYERAPPAGVPHGQRVLESSTSSQSPPTSAGSYADNAQRYLNTAAEHLEKVRAGQDPYATARGFVSRGFPSPISETRQGYSVYVPRSSESAARPTPLLVMLHGGSSDRSLLLAVVFGEDRRRVGQPAPAHLRPVPPAVGERLPRSSRPTAWGR